MKLFTPTLLCSITLLATDVLATPRIMPMLDDSALKETRVDYLTGLEKTRADEADGDEEAPSRTPDSRALTEPSANNPAAKLLIIPSPTSTRAPGVSVDLRPR